MRDHVRSAVLAAVITAAPLVAPPPVAAAELVTNGGFETGNLTGWMNAGGTITATAHTGSFGYVHAGNTSSALLAQSVATVAGQSYTYSFWVKNASSPPSTIYAALGPNILLTRLDNLPIGAFTRFTGTVVADAAATTLVFSLNNTVGDISIDDISLTTVDPVPEPATWALLLTGFGAAGAAIRRRRRLPA